MKKVVLIIQARMGSKRLPGKSMMPLAGEPLVGRILERVKRCTKIDEVVLAIPENKSDDTLYSLGESYQVKVVRGSEEDLLSRFILAVKQTDAEIVVRIPADNPTPEPNEIDKIISFHSSQKSRGFSSNLCQIFNSGYPDGIGAEVFEASYLFESINKNPSKEKREHIHLNFFDYSKSKIIDEKWCPVRTIKCPKEYNRPDLVLDVNTYEQYIFMNSLYENLYPKNPNFSIKDIIFWYDNVYAVS